MKRMVWKALLLAGLGLTACSSCDLLSGPAPTSATGGMSVEAEVADAIAVVVNAATPALVRAAEEDEPGPDTDVKWERIEAAHDALRIAHDAYATSIEQGQRPSVQTLLGTYCTFWHEIPSSVKEELSIPQAELLCAPAPEVSK